MDTSHDNTKTLEELNNLFGNYRAEWLREQLYEHFAQPNYFPQLLQRQTCLLEGGRGTDKTTVLKSLSYEGQYALAKKQLSSMPIFGIYYRVNTNRVASFTGGGLPPEIWMKIFSHYFNLLICSLTCDMLNWYNEKHPLNIPATLCNEVAASLSLKDTNNFEELALDIRRAMILCEAKVNNLSDEGLPNLSMLGGPIDIMYSHLNRLTPFIDKPFYIIIDEYENFSDMQQKVINTLIKHSGQYYNFKVGVKPLGFRIKQTIKDDEQLLVPADYDIIDLQESFTTTSFREFALRVCDERISKLSGNKIDLANLFRGLTEDQEAERLGVVEQSKILLGQIKDKRFRGKLEALSPFQVQFLKSWADANEISLSEAYEESVSLGATWDHRFNNYKHAMLYGIRRGKPGLRKYYCGWDVLSQLAGKNIRYVLELVKTSLVQHIQDGNCMSDALSPELQTRACQFVGRMNLKDLEGISIQGASLSKLLLGLGRVFQVMASNPFGHAPEVNQFFVTHLNDTADQLLRSGVMHQALVRTPGTKPGTVSDTRDYDYFIHPIFSAFFVFSFRKKRKMQLSSEDLLGLVDSHKITIQHLLSRQNRTEADMSLPEQMELFEGYYANA